MAKPTQQAKGRLTAAWISALYALLASLWIYASDALVYLIADNSQQLATFQFYKGFLFIGVTAFLLYALVNHTLTAISAKNELAQQALVQHFDYLAKYGNDIVLLMDNSGQILEVNASAASAYGYPHQELLQLNFRNLQASETLTMVDGQMQQLKRKGSLLFETMHKRKDGSEFPVEVSLRAIAIQGINFLDSIIRDISERKQAEAALRASEARYRILFEQAPDSILLIDLKTAAIIGFNDKAHENLGYTREEFRRLTVADIKSLESSDEIARHVHRIVETGSDNFETKLRTKANDIRDMLVNSRVVEIDGKTFIQSLCRDITERKRMETRMRRQEIQLIQADKMAAIGILVSGVAHEINNPNQMMQMNAQSLLGTWGDLVDLLDSYLDEDQVTWVGNLPYGELRETFPMLLQDIVDGAVKIQKIVAELRDFARPSDNTLPTTFNLNTVIKRALDLLSHAIKKKTERLQVNLENNLPLLVGNPQQIEQVIVNLVLNALDALPDASRAIRLSTHADWATNRVELQVEDEGMGIPAEHLERIFEPFFTTKQDQGGTGLGLFITYKLVMAHGGTLSFTSKPGQGTVVCVKLPLISNIHHPHHDTALSTANSPSG
jgi:PAS domain S-box-containing protein